MCAPSVILAVYTASDKKKKKVFVSYCRASPQGTRTHSSTTARSHSRCFLSPIIVDGHGKRTLDENNGRKDPRVSKMGHAQQHKWSPIFNWGIKTTGDQVWVGFLRYILLLQYTITVLVAVFLFRGSMHIPCSFCSHRRGILRSAACHGC